MCSKFSKWYKVKTKQIKAGWLALPLEIAGDIFIKSCFYDSTYHFVQYKLRNNVYILANRFLHRIIMLISK